MNEVFGWLWKEAAMGYGISLEAPTDNHEKNTKPGSCIQDYQKIKHEY